MSSNRSVGYFLQEHTTLFPENTLIPDIKDEDWVVDLKKYFDDLLYQYYYNRIIFYDEDKYPIHDETTSYNNIRKTISIMLNTKAYTYGKLWESTKLEYNPIWNVDGVTETDRELKQHIKDVDKHRAQYYGFYTDQKWGDRKNYDLCVNTTNADIKNVAAILTKLFE